MTCNVYTINYKVDVLKDEDFYIYLERGKNNMWQSLIFEYLDKPVKTLEDDTFEIKVYKPSYVADKNKGISLPLKRV